MFYLIAQNGKIVASARSVTELRRSHPIGEFTVAQASGILRRGEYVQSMANEYPYLGKKLEVG